MVTIPIQRHLFDIPAEVAYFNCAYNSPQLNRVRERLLAGALRKSSPWQRTPDDFFNDAETIRRLAADLFGATPDGYAVVPAASYGLSAAARAIEPQLQPADEIVLMAEEFPSNVLPWRRLARVTGAVIATVATPADADWTGAVLAAITENTRVVAVSSCHWTNGAVLDLVQIARACRSQQCALVVDATQTLGAMPFSIDEVQPDFLVAAGYKWLLCPYGFGLMYVAPHWRDARPLEESWLARSNALDFAALVNYSEEYMPGARRFDVGEKCTATILPGAIAALEQIKEWGVPAIAASLSQLNARISVQLEGMGFCVPPAARRCPHMFGATLPPGGARNLVADLKAQHIYISQRGSALRFAPHLHITDHDMLRLTSALERVLGATR